MATSPSTDFTPYRQNQSSCLQRSCDHDIENLVGFFSGGTGDAADEVRCSFTFDLAFELTARHYAGA
jgi:hypothetical protein